MNRIHYPSGEDGLRLVIKEDQVKVAPEERVKIHVGVINKGSSEDYFNILVRGLPANWTTVDTPVISVGPGQAKQVTLTVQPPSLPQSRVGEYPLDVEAVSQSDPKRAAAAHGTVIIAAYESRGRIGVMLGSLHFSAAPGSTITIPILLQNRGLEEDSFRLNVQGIPASWISTNSAITMLAPSASKEVQLTIRVPRSSEAVAGRMPFKIQVISQEFPDQRAEVDCVLTIAAFSKFSASLQPGAFQAGQPGQLIINNEGNIADTYTVDFEDPANVLMFEKRVPVSTVGPRPRSGQVETTYVEIPRGERFQVGAGDRGIYEFRTRLRSRPIVGNEKIYPFTVTVRSAENQSLELPTQVSEKAIIPIWLLSTLIIGSIILCFVLLIPVNAARNAARATQTTAYNLTQAALSGNEDFDGDGLINSIEIQLKTDPLKPDTDGDGLSDGEEVNTYRTNPLVADTDKDGLPDGEEVLRYKTDPLNPDSDGDLVNDGTEIQNRTDPLKLDTDGDGLSDGAEASLGTDPLQQDTDKDGLLDGQENQTCPRPLTPDSDGDGILDGNDPDPCNRAVPASTASAIVVNPTSTTASLPTPIPPTAVPPTSIPTSTTVPTNIPTNPPFATQTPAPPTLQGTMVFASNRDGNSEIYALNLNNQVATRLTNNAAQDMQPALAPDSVRVAFVTNRDGNNEIYLGGVDGRLPLNITNNAADDQQPVWSPDGNWIAFTTNRDGNQEIYVMRSDGSEAHNLTNNPANDFAPTWYSVRGIFGSEDWIAFTSTRDGNQEVYKVKPDGSGLTNLTQNPANDYSPSGFTGGELLAFVSERDGNPEIYTMNDRGGAVTNITNNPAQDLDPSINPNGGWIAFSTDREGNLEVYVVKVSGGTAYNLTRNPSQDQHPDW